MPTADVIPRLYYRTHQEVAAASMGDCEHTTNRYIKGSYLLEKIGVLKNIAKLEIMARVFGGNFILHQLPTSASYISLLHQLSAYPHRLPTVGYHIH